MKRKIFFVTFIMFCFLLSLFAETRQQRDKRLEEALRHVETWNSVIMVTNPGVDDLPDVKLLNEGASALLKLDTDFIERMEGPFDSLASALFKLDIDQAINASQKVLEINPRIEKYNWLGVVVDLVKPDKSGQFVGVQFISVKSVPAAALCNLGIALKISRLHDESIVAFKKAIALRPDFFPAHNNLGWVLKSKNELDEAIDSFHECLRLKPEFAEAQANLGVTLFLKNERELAISELGKAKKLYEDAKREVDVKVIEKLLSELSSSSIQEHWSETAKKDTREAYEGFLKSYPSGQHSAEAHHRLDFYLALDSAISISKIEGLMKKYQDETFTYKAIPKLEDLLIKEIEEQGPHDRFVIKALMPTGNEGIAGVTFSEGDTPGTFKVTTEFPGDAIMVTGGGPFNTRVHRYRGKIPVGGALEGYVFIGVNDKLTLLTFAQVRDVGYVYLRGRGKIILPNGREVLLGY